MLPKIKLLISQNDTIIQTVSREVDSNNLVKTIETFQEVANATLTKMIDELSGLGDLLEEEEGESDSDDDVDTNPKKRKK